MSGQWSLQTVKLAVFLWGSRLYGMLMLQDVYLLEVQWNLERKNGTSGDRSSILASVGRRIGSVLTAHAWRGWLWTSSRSRCTRFMQRCHWRGPWADSVVSSSTVQLYVLYYTNDVRYFPGDKSTDRVRSTVWRQSSVSFVQNWYIRSWSELKLFCIIAVKSLVNIN